MVSRLRSVRAAMLHALRRTLRSHPVISTSQALLDYVHLDMASLPVERLRILHLNARNMLIRDEVAGEGTIDGVTVHVREIIARALELGTAALVLVHNHPSGDPAPSAADVATTRLIIAAGSLLGIEVHDHLVVTAHDCASMRGLGLI